MPTYNAEQYLKDSIESVLNQSYSDFDFYIYDDCSTDCSKELIETYKDFRIFYRKNNINLGIAKTLNIGLEELLSNYEYIARMDADDWCYPDRFEKQLAFMEANGNICISGTQGYWLKDICLNPISGWKYPLRHEYIEKNLLFAASFGHSSVIFRSKFFKNYKLRYDEKISTCEDWDLWIRIVKIGKVANLPGFFMKYRILDDSNHRSSEKNEKHLEERSKILSDYWFSLGIALSSEQIFDFYFNQNAVLKREFIRNIKIIIEAFNRLYQKSCSNLTQEERTNFRYLLARKILNYWKRTKLSRLNPLVWMVIINEVQFMNKFRLIKSILR